MFGVFYFYFVSFYGCKVVTLRSLINLSLDRVSGG